MQERFGKNAVLKGMNLQKKGTTIQRNGQIGGHRAGNEDPPPRQKAKKPEEKAP
jgi:DNA polymerase V